MSVTCPNKDVSQWREDTPQHGGWVGARGLGGAGWLTGARSAVTEGESQSQDLEEEEELRGCLGRQQVNKVRPMGVGGPSGAHQHGLVPSASAPNTHLFCGACAHSGTGATMWGRRCCTEPASRASCAASRTLCGRWACDRPPTLWGSRDSQGVHYLPRGEGRGGEAAPRCWPCAGPRGGALSRGGNRPGQAADGPWTRSGGTQALALLWPQP